MDHLSFCNTNLSVVFISLETKDIQTLCPWESIDSQINKVMASLLEAQTDEFFPVCSHFGLS